MAVSLVVRIGKSVLFEVVLEKASAIVSRMLNLEIVPKLVWGLPPLNRGESLEGQRLDQMFPGAYVRFQGVEASLATLLVFNSPAGGSQERLLLSCSAEGRSPASDILVAALAAAAADLSGGSIDDAGHHWVDKDECLPEELIQALQLPEESPTFSAAVDLAHFRQAFHERSKGR